MLFRPVFTVERWRVCRFVFTVVGAREVPYQVFAAYSQVRVLVEVANGVTWAFCLILRDVEIGGVRCCDGPRSIDDVGRFFRLFEDARAQEDHGRAQCVMTGTAMVQVFLGNRGLGAIMADFYCAEGGLFARLAMDSGFFFLLDRASVTFVGGW